MLTAPPAVADPVGGVIETALPEMVYEIAPAHPAYTDVSAVASLAPADPSFEVDAVQEATAFAVAALPANVGEVM